jgi:hypothetical protein
MDRFAVRRSRIFAVLALTLFRPCGSFGAETDQSARVGHESCTVVRMQPTGMLMGCGTRMRSLRLTMQDSSRTTRFTPDGLFHFYCPLDVMCDGRPRIDGWIILKEVWQKSSQDADAIIEMLRLPPAVRGPDSRPAELLPKTAKSACGTFSINIAGLDGRAACYDSSDKNSVIIAVIASGPELGFAILFSQINADWQTLRDKVINLAPRLKLERAEGDIELMKWLR